MQEERVSHDDYKAGVKNGTIRIGIMDRSEFRKLLLKRHLNIIEGILMVLNILLNIAIPFLCFVFHNWSLLFGFAGCFIGWILHLICISPQKSGTRIKRSKITFIILIIAGVIVIYNFGIISLASFVLACTLCEFIIFYFTGNLLMEMAIRNLAKNENDYYFALNNGIIKTFRTY